MLKKLYVHNFRCLQNFELPIEGLSSVLLLGKNGSGKTSVFDAFAVLQHIGQGRTLVKELISDGDFALGDTSKPIVFEVHVKFRGHDYTYRLEIDYPEKFRAPKVKTEILSVDQHQVLHREGGKTVLNGVAAFTLDGHHIGLPLVDVRSDEEPIAVFRQWLAEVIILSPSPRHFANTSKSIVTHLDREGRYVLDWVRHHLADNPSLYNPMATFLKQRMMDFEVLKFETVGKDERELIFEFRAGQAAPVRFNFSQLSDGEKIYFLTAALVAIIDNGHPVLCFWDEPDHYVSLMELEHFIVSARKAFENHADSAQLVITTHHQRVMNEFSEHNTFILTKPSQLIPTRIELLQNKHYVSPRMIDAYEHGELD